MKIKDFSLKSIVIFNVFLWLFLISIFVFYHIWTHTLYKNGNWESTKTKLEKGVMGAWSFMFTHRALADNCLDLGTWHGFQEVFYKDSVDYETLEFDFSLSDDSYLTFFFNKNQDTFTGIRISNCDSLPSMYLKVFDEKFYDHKIINGLQLKEGWNACKLKLETGIVFVYINDVLSFKIKDANLSANTIGFRGCLSSTLIDNVVFYDKNGSVEFKDGFKRKFGHYWALFVAAICANLVFLVFYKRKTIWFILVINASFIGLAFLIFFMVYGQYIYPKKWMIEWNSQKTTIETQDSINARVVRKYNSEVYNNLYKLMFVGTSQTWGAGAVSESNSFVKVFEDRLADTFGQNRLCCINTGISGSNSTELLKFYKGSWIQINPDLVIINLSLNDSGNPVFKENVETFIQINKKNHIKTVLILEPVALETTEVLTNHSILRELAQNYDLMLIDMPSYLRGYTDDGFLYWDVVHLTNYGQRLFAEKLYNELHGFVQENVQTDL